jgi:hypothetical protein
MVKQTLNLSLRATEGSEAPASPRQMQLLQSRGRGGAISILQFEIRDRFVAIAPRDDKE